MNHGSAQNGRLIGVDHEAHGHEFKPEALDGKGRSPRIDVRYPHHDGDAGAVNVGVHQAHAPAADVQCKCQVGGHGRFADAALAAGHGHDVADAGQGDLLRAAPGGMHVRSPFGSDQRSEVRSQKVTSVTL